MLPRLSVLEMRACLPSDEVAFKAKDAEACQCILENLDSAPSMSLVDVIQSLMASDAIEPDLFKLAAFPMFLAIGGKSSKAIAALYQLIFNKAIESMILTSKIQLIGASQDLRFKGALARWKVIWEQLQRRQESQDQSGFMIHAGEVWLLAHKVLETDVSILISAFGTNDMTQIRRWLTELN